MKNSAFKLFFIFLMTTFSFIWISEKLAVILDNEKYDLYETTEKSETENQTENKLKTLFINQIDFLNLTQFLPSNSKNHNSFYSFNLKEFCFENRTPPPENI